jgi:hypothetical protein
MIVIMLAWHQRGNAWIETFSRTLITLTLSVSVDSIGDLNGLGFRLC